LIGIRHAPTTSTTTTTTSTAISKHSNTEHYRDYESVFIVPGPSCHNQNRKQTFLSKTNDIFFGDLFYSYVFNFDI